jgi:hypothetical protein
MSGGAIEQFVRGVLGCSCPEAVFRSVTLEDNPPAFSGLLPARLLRIGGRLLVLLVEPREQDVPVLPLQQLVTRARQLREAEGCNRVRLVVAAPSSMHALLTEAFTGLGGLDERLHLHVVTPGQLPPALVSPQLHGMQQ